MQFRRFVAVLLGLGFASLPYAEKPLNDTVKGAKDHPLLSRFQGANLVGYQFKEFDEVKLPAGKRVRENGRSTFEKTLRLEGKYTLIAYNYPRQRSSLEVMRNYQSALEREGLKTLFACANEACGENFGQWLLDNGIDGYFIQGGEEYWAPFNYGRS